MPFRQRLSRVPSAKRPFFCPVLLPFWLDQMKRVLSPYNCHARIMLKRRSHSQSPSCLSRQGRALVVSVATPPVFTNHVVLHSLPLKVVSCTLHVERSQPVCQSATPVDSPQRPTCNSPPKTGLRHGTLDGTQLRAWHFIRQRTTLSLALYSPQSFIPEKSPSCGCRPGRFPG